MRRGGASVKLRTGTPADLSSVTEIYNGEVSRSTSTFDTEPRGEASAREWLDAHRSEAFPLVVAEDDGLVVGWASLSPWSPRGAYRHTVEGSLFVRDGHRGRGVGRLLTRELLARAGMAGHCVVVARIESGNAASRALLLSEGFRSVGVMHQVGRKLGRWLDVEVFERLLDDVGEDLSASAATAAQEGGGRGS
jgi:L-amino acid N-acyltransferase YncA